MKKQLLTLVATAGTIGSAFAQLPVGTAPSNRKVVLEEFTGIHCQYCPDGHKMANDLKASKPAGDVVLVNIHTGGYATPGSGEPDYRTAEGNSIANMSGMNITGYPTGDINRHLFAGEAGMSVSRSNWVEYADSVLARPSYVNVALEGTLDVNTRVLTVNAEVYYTGNSPVANNYLTIALLEDNVVGPQTSGAIWNPAQTNPDGTYNHQHMLRKVLTPTFGQTITTTSATNTYSTSISYTIPAQYVNNACNIGNLDIIAFVAESQKEIVTAAYGPITLTGFTNALDAGLNTLKSEAEVCAANLNPEFQLMNYGSSAITSAVISYNVNGGTAQTYTYTNATGLASYQTAKIALPVINFAPQASNVLSVSVTGINGSADQNAANDAVTKTVPLTSLASNFTNMYMYFTQDAFGSESTWSVKDDATGAVIASGGPYTDLGAVGTVLHVSSFTVAQNTCYKLTVNDAFGDGVNSGYGVGGYKLVAGSAAIYTSNGQFGQGESKWYKASSTAGSNVGINESNSLIANINIYPNPASTASTVEVELAQNENLTVSVMNAFGQVVYTENVKDAAAGSHLIQLNSDGWASGIYNVSVSTSKGAISRKLTIAK